MAIGASTVWRVRIAGNDANGAGYDSTISGAGTDYSQQDSPQMSVTDIACSNNTTVTSATGGFTSAMIGNAIRITGGGATSGYYFITGRTDTNTITVDRTPGTVANGTGKVGGAAATFAAALFVNGNSAGNKCVAGNTIYIGGSGTSTPSSADYTISARVTPPSGTSTATVTIEGENGMPFVDCAVDIAFLSSPNYSKIVNILFKSSSPNTIIFHSSDNVRVERCVFKLNARAVTLTTGSNGIFTGCEIDGQCTGAVSGSTVTLAGNALRIVGCYIHHMGSHGITAGNWCTIEWNIIRKNYGDAIYIATSAGTGVVTIANNTIDDGSGNGIWLNSQSIVQNIDIHNNIISNHIQSGKTGLVVNGGSATISDGQKCLIDYNCVYNNTANYSGISASAHDINTDPQYTDQANGDYRLGASSPCKAAGFPGQFLNGTNNYSYIDIGAVQRQESGGSSSSRQVNIRGGADQ